jgi:hypothetical protein
MANEVLERWSTMKYTPWNIMKHCPIKYNDFLSTPYLRKLTQNKAERFLYSMCAWSRAGGIPGQLAAICAERLGITPADATKVNRLAVLQSYFHTLYPLSSPHAAVSVRYIGAKEALIAAIEALDTIEALPLEVCAEYVAATQEHIATFGAAPDKGSHAYVLEKALVVYADIQRILAETQVKMPADGRLEKIESFMREGGKAEEMAYIRQLFARE